MPISITSICINNQELIVVDPDKSVSWFRSFMHFCIDNKRTQILNNNRLELYFKLSPNDVSLEELYIIKGLKDMETYTFTIN